MSPFGTENRTLTHLLHPPLGADGQEAVVLPLQGGSGLEGGGKGGEHSQSTQSMHG